MSFKNKLLSGAAFLGMAIAPSIASAVDNVTVSASIITNAGITVAKTADIAFGTWLIGINSTDTPTITLNSTNATLTTAAVGSSQLIELTGATAGTAGAVTVDLPSGANNITMQMQRSAITDFTDGGLSLTAITYDSDDAAPAALAVTTNVPIIVETGGTPEPVTFGATITADATPANATHTASFKVTFSY